MEMNTRLQVEHPVTEMVTGLDLVEWQLRVAAGEPLPLKQNQLAFRGHALEARIYAEDPARAFLPSIGKLSHLRLPVEDAHVRVDAGVEEGDVISAHYDPMIAKLIVWDETREKALSRMRAALADFQIAGVASNIGFLSRLVACGAFAQANLDTALIERESAVLFPLEAPPPDEVFFLAALTQILGEQGVKGCGRHDGWRLNGAFSRALAFRCGEFEKTVEATYLGQRFRLASGRHSVTARGRLTGRRIVAEFDGHRIEAVVVASHNTLHVFSEGVAHKLERLDPLDVAAEGGSSHGGLLAPMPGRITALLVEPGEKVEKGAPLLVLEAMKMEHKLTAPATGAVKAFFCGVEDQVSEGAELVDFEAETV
jgi:3-methylcrotonyl-CoA carboxylase alpha subunit